MSNVDELPVLPAEVAELSPLELDRLEAIIQRGLQTFFSEIGRFYLCGSDLEAA